MPSEDKIMQQAMAASTSAGTSHPNTSSSVALTAYMPPNMSDDEMLQRAIAESTNSNRNQARGGEVNDDPMSMSLSMESSDSSVMSRIIGRCLSPVLQSPPHNSLFHRIHDPPSAILLLPLTPRFSHQ